MVRPGGVLEVGQLVGLATGLHGHVEYTIIVDFKCREETTDQWNFTETFRIIVVSSTQDLYQSLMIIVHDLSRKKL